MSTKLDFDKLSQLYKDDPAAFEEYRAQEIEKLIQGASERSQQRLRGLQFQIDAKRSINKSSPVKACMEISQMMHESFENMRYQLNKLTNNEECVNYRYPIVDHSEQTQASAKVVSFSR